MVDVVHLAGVILQHVLVAGLHDRSRETLGVSGSWRSRVWCSGRRCGIVRVWRLCLIRSLCRRRLLGRRRIIRRRGRLGLRRLLRRRSVRRGRRLSLRRRLIRGRRSGLSERAAPGDHAEDDGESGNRRQRDNPIFH